MEKRYIAWCFDPANADTVINVAECDSIEDAQNAAYDRGLPLAEIETVLREPA